MLSTLQDRIGSTILSEGGPELLAAKIICEWHPELYSSAEYEEAQEVLRRHGLRHKNTYVVRPVRLDRSNRETYVARKTAGYTLREIKYITENWGRPDMSAEQISRKLRRNIHSVRHFANELGLKSAPGQKLKTVKKSRR